MKNNALLTQILDELRILNQRQAAHYKTLRNAEYAIDVNSKYPAELLTPKNCQQGLYTVNKTYGNVAHWCHNVNGNNHTDAHEADVNGLLVNWYIK